MYSSLAACTFNKTYLVFRQHVNLLVIITVVYVEVLHMHHDLVCNAQHYPSNNLPPKGEQNYHHHLSLDTTANENYRHHVPFIHVFSLPKGKQKILPPIIPRHYEFSLPRATFIPRHYKLSLPKANKHYFHHSRHYEFSLPHIHLTYMYICSENASPPTSHSSS